MFFSSKRYNSRLPRTMQYWRKFMRHPLVWADLAAVRGKPFVVRLTTGLLRPKHKVPGIDVSRRVEVVGKNMSQYSHRTSKEDLVVVTELIQAGRVRPATDRRYPLSEVAEALRHCGEGHSQRKVVITVTPNNGT